MKLGKFISNYLEQHDLTQRQFATKCDLSNGMISMLISEKNPKTGEPIKPSITTLKKISNGMGITLNELLENIDDMETLILIENTTNVLPISKYKKIPLLGNIACGKPVLANENIESYFACPENIDADFCLCCKGDSMLGARIHDGDIVYIRQQPYVENGEIAAVLIDDEATLKRIFIENDRIILQPENSKYKPLTYIKEEMNQIKILGKAIYFLSKVK